jgi:hypothetical protein
MKLVLVALALLQFGPRPALSEPGISQRAARRVEGAPLTPAETLLEPAILKAIDEEPTSSAAVSVIAGTDASAGDILLTCAAGQCTAATHAAQKLQSLIGARRLPQPARAIRVISAIDPLTIARARAAIHVAQSADRPLQVVRGLWSTAGIGDEVAEVFGRHGSFAIDVRSHEELGQLALDAYGVPTTTIVANAAMSNQQAALVAAASAYFLATLPNAGAESLLSHLTVGAHARLAEDGRKAVAQMGNQQRASADVLIMFGQAIEREQRRMRSFEAFMPAPVDPMLRSRIADMEKGITSVWTSIGITSSPFVPAAERIRGRGGEDRRVPSRVKTGPLPRPELPTAFLKFPNVDVVVSELGNFIDGQRSISDIRDAVSAEFAPIALPVVVEYFERLARAGAITIR